MTGFVYVMGVPNDNLLKIGRSTQPQVRLKQMRTKSKIRALELLHVAETSNSHGLEQATHSLLRRQRIYRRDEWFLCTLDEAVSAINRAMESSAPGFAQRWLDQQLAEIYT